MRMNTTMTLTDTRPVDKQVLVGIYEQHSPGLFRYAYRLLGDKDMAEECVSETFSRFLQALNNGGGPKENVQGYLYRVAHNWITDQYRRQPAPTLSLEVEEHPDDQSNPAKIIAQALERERVRVALLRLPPEQRQVVVLRLLEQWPHQEVADTLGKTVEATRALQYRAMAALRRMLIDEKEENTHD